MDDELDGVADHLKERSTWLRIFFMVGFGLALYVVGIVILFITLAQALFSIFTGSDNRNLRLLGADLSEYVGQILRYLTYNSATRPFPFSPFPDSDGPATAVEPEPDQAGEAYSEEQVMEGELQVKGHSGQRTDDASSPLSGADRSDRQDDPDGSQDAVQPQPDADRADHESVKKNS